MSAPKRQRQHAGAANDWSSRPERSRALPLRLMRWMSLRLGRGATRWLLWPVVLAYLATSPTARAASRRYLSAALGRRAGLRDVLRHFHAFATTIHDRVYLLNGRLDLFDIRVHGEDAVQRIVARGDGAFLMGAHLGSFEAVRAVGGRIPEVRLAVMMYEDNASRLNEALATINPAMRQHVIPLGRLDAMLRARSYLERGYLIGLLADRTLARLATDPVRVLPFLGTPAPFATGPLRMAAMLRREVLFIAAVHGGGNRYDVHFETLADFSATPADQRDAAIETALARYVAMLERHCRAAPYNWFNFYDFWAMPDTPASPAQASLP
ncbi:hypothetical protein L602_002200000250 [Cupriavidus gilardii J11]|uniref:LPLAT superfamily acyltransferase n=1 Tax=Cupriavidus gilardii J11 TaxID=936133 RepID=A0A562BM16_9BURK|nr:acyl-CoA synthetase [Cupriavidus gilardii]TWG85970.1 hypothetical protein L602_002200000250 [Cupriavidus gilardii J11]